MDALLNLVSSQLPPAIRPYLSAFASSSTDESDNPIINFAKQHLPLVMSLVALYFGVMSMMRTARMAWRTFLFTAKWGIIATVISTLYSAYNHGPQAALAQTQNIASQVIKTAGPIGTLAGWYFGNNGQWSNLKQAAGWVMGQADGQKTDKKTTPLANRSNKPSAKATQDPISETVQSFVQQVAGWAPAGALEGYMQNGWKGAFDAVAGEYAGESKPAKKKKGTGWM